MPPRRIAATLSALALSLALSGPALADDPTVDVPFEDVVRGTMMPSTDTVQLPADQPAPIGLLLAAGTAAALVTIRRTRRPHHLTDGSRHASL